MATGFGFDFDELDALDGSTSLADDPEQGISLGYDHPSCQDAKESIQSEQSQDHGEAEEDTTSDQAQKTDKQICPVHHDDQTFPSHEAKPNLTTATMFNTSATKLKEERPLLDATRLQFYNELFQAELQAVTTRIGSQIGKGTGKKMTALEQKLFSELIVDWPEHCEGLWTERQEAWWALRLIKATDLSADVSNKVPTLTEQPRIFRLADPKMPIRYGTYFGTCRTPVTFLVAPPEEGLASYLRLDPNGPFAGGPLDWIYARDTPWWQKWDLVEDREKVTKADWHAVPSSSEGAERFVPRLGKSVRMPRAPPRIEAFAESFRAVNRVVWSAVHDALEGLVWYRSKFNPFYAKGEGKIIHDLADQFLTHGHFGVVEAQLRWGDGELMLPSHVDGATSLLHLGVTLGGTRTLRTATFPGHNTYSKVEKNVWNEAMWDEDHVSDVTMTKGCIYLSSPFCFEHAVRYHSCGMKDPVIALQFRFALDSELGPKINEMRDDTMRDVTSIIAGVLKVAGDNGSLRVPSIQDVQAAENRLLEAARFRRGGGQRPRTTVQLKPKAKAKRANYL